MILINLLPPELRRARRSGVNPVLLAAVAGGVVVLGLAALWMWIALGRIPAAERLLAQKDAELAAATAEAEKVRQIDKQIAEFQTLHATITGLIGRKVFWARTLDDFANLLAQVNDNRWSREGYEVRCTSLTVAPAAAAAAGRGKPGSDAMIYSFRAAFRIVGERSDQAGDYTQSFFRSVEMSRFWREHGFAGRTEDPYKGDQWQFKKDIDRVVVDMPLEWRRIQSTATAKAAPKGGRP